MSVWEVLQELERVEDTPSKTKCGSGKKQKNSTVVTDQTMEDPNQENTTASYYTYWSYSDRRGAASNQMKEEQGNPNQRCTAAENSKDSRNGHQQITKGGRSFEILEYILTGDVYKKRSSLSTMLMYAV